MDNNYVVIVSNGNFVSPSAVQDGRYKLVRIPDCEELSNFHSFDKLKEEHYSIKPLSNILVRACNSFKRTEIKYIEDLEGYKDLEHIRNLGNKCIALVIALCKKYEVNITYSHEKYEHEVRSFLAMLGISSD